MQQLLWSDWHPPVAIDFNIRRLSSLWLYAFPTLSISCRLRTLCSQWTSSSDVNHDFSHSHIYSLIIIRCNCSSLTLFIIHIILHSPPTPHLSFWLEMCDMNPSHPIHSLWLSIPDESSPLISFSSSVWQEMSRKEDSVDWETSWDDATTTRKKGREVS